MSTPNLRSDEAKQVSRESLTTRARLVGQVGQFCDMSDVCGPGNRRCMSGPAGRHLGYTEPQVLHAAFRAVVSTGEDHAVKEGVHRLCPLIVPHAPRAGIFLGLLQYFTVFVKTAETWFDSPDVMTALLKFLQVLGILVLVLWVGNL
jgi:hypothetical protein